jgi:hypothetical protein
MSLVMGLGGKLNLKPFSYRIRCLPKYIASPHIPEHCPIKGANDAHPCHLLHIFPKSFCSRPYSSSTFLQTAILNHLQSHVPHTQTISIYHALHFSHALNTQMTVLSTGKTSLLLLSFKDTQHIHLTITCSAFSSPRLYRFQILSHYLHFSNQEPGLFGELRHGQ